MPPLPPLGLGSAAVDTAEETLVLDVLRRRELFRYYGDNPDHPPPMVATLEREFRELIGIEHALAVNSGTAALEVALGAMGIGPGDEVILPAWSWLSVLTSVVRVGARPVLAEIDDSLCLDPAEIARLHTPRTRAVIVVHFQGMPARMDAIVTAAHRRGIYVLEDVAESPGATYLGRRLGTWSDAAIFSFQHNKPMTAGEGGMVVTRDFRLYERAVRLHDLGQYRPHHLTLAPAKEPMMFGSNHRMSELTAAVALAQLRKLDAIRDHCRGLRDRVLSATGDLPGLTWRRGPDPAGDFGFELYAYLPDAEITARFRDALRQRNVHGHARTGTYPQYHRDYLKNPVTHHPAASPFRDLTPWPAPGYRAEDFPRTEDLTRRMIALPLGWRFTRADADHIAASLRAIHAEILG